MANERYVLRMSSDLRDAIADKNYEDILEYLGKAWSEIHHAFPEEFDWDDLRANMSPILIEKDNLSRDKNIDMVEVEKKVKDLIDNLCNYCEVMGILVDL